MIVFDATHSNQIIGRTIPDLVASENPEYLRWRKRGVEIPAQRAIVHPEFRLHERSIIGTLVKEVGAAVQ